MNTKNLQEYLDKQEKELNELKALIKQLQEKVQSERTTVSYKLGYALIHDTKTLKGIIGLPKKLFEIYKYNLNKKQTLEIEHSKLEPNISSSANSANNSQPEELTKNTIIKESPTVQLTKGLTLLDPISELCWNDAFVGYPISRQKFENQIQTSTSQFAFLESAWRANKSTWLYAFTSPGLKHANAQALLKAIDLLKQRNIPILFWNKEDPMHYEMFKPIAKHADYIFTTDALIVDKYKKELGNQQVYALPFAAPVKKTNPLHRFSLKAESVCFAGTYYAKNHADRKKQMDMLLPALLESNGVIYDRASGEQKDDYAYPEQYKHILRPAVDFKEMVELYKKFQIFLNVNTITQSPTMMSRRVYELLASGTPVISTPSKAITEQFPGIVITVANEKEAKLAVQRLLKDSYYWHKQSMLGIREVMQKHTYEQRWSEIESIVLNKEMVIAYPKVQVISVYHGYIDLEIHLASLTYQQKVDITEIILLKSSSLSLDDNVVQRYKVKVFNLNEFNLKNYIKESDKEYYTLITDDKVYHFKNSLLGMCLAFKYSKAAAVIRSYHYKYSKVISREFSIDNPNWYEYMREVPSSCVLLRNKLSDQLVIDLHKKQIKSVGEQKNILMIDPFNMVTLDTLDIVKDKNTFNNFIYKVSPYLGV